MQARCCLTFYMAYILNVGMEMCNTRIINIENITYRTPIYGLHTWVSFQSEFPGSSTRIAKSLFLTNCVSN